MRVLSPATAWPLSFQAPAQPVVVLVRVQGRCALRSQARCALDPALRAPNRPGLGAWKESGLSSPRWLRRHNPSRVPPRSPSTLTASITLLHGQLLTRPSLRSRPGLPVSVTAPQALSRWETIELVLADCSTGHPRTPTCTRPAVAYSECAWKHGGWQTADTRMQRREARHSSM